MVTSEAYLAEKLDSFVKNWNRDSKSKLSIVKKEIKFDAIFAILHLLEEGKSYSIIWIHEGNATSFKYKEIYFEKKKTFKDKKVILLKRIERQWICYITADGLVHKVSY